MNDERQQETDWNKVPVYKVEVTPGQRALSLLESLTPGGSEFSGDPEACAAFAQRRIADLEDTAKRLVRQRNEARARSARVQQEALALAKAQTADLAAVASQVEWTYVADDLPEVDPEWGSVGVIGAILEDGQAVSDKFYLTQDGDWVDEGDYSVPVYAWLAIPDPPSPEED